MYTIHVLLTERNIWEQGPKYHSTVVNNGHICVRLYIYTHTFTHISYVVLKVRLNCEIYRLPRKEILDFFWDLHCLDVCVRAQGIRLWNPWPGSASSYLISWVLGLAHPGIHQVPSCHRPFALAAVFVQQIQLQIYTRLTLGLNQYENVAQIFLALCIWNSLPFPNTPSLSIPWPCTFYGTSHCMFIYVLFKCLLSIFPSGT